MAKNNRLSRDQKRKAKQTERARRKPLAVSLAYTGDKYKTDELVPVHFHTEMGIYEAFVMSDRSLTDHMVTMALTSLIIQMRNGPLPPLEEKVYIDNTPGNTENLIIWNIRRNWQDLFQTQKNPGSEKMRGVLRTILGSITIWSSPVPQSRGYLHYIAGMLKKAGMSVKVYSEEDRKPILEPAEDELLSIGRKWCDGDDSAGDEFHQRIDHLIAAGQTERVIAITQYLVGEIGQTPQTNQLLALSLKAQQAMRIEMK